MNDADRRRVHRAALSVGLYVGIASALVVAAGVGILLFVILHASRPDDPFDGQVPTSAPREGDHLVIDVDRIMPWVLGLGLAGVIVLAVVAALAARRSVRPLGEALRLQRNFVADASHELRTPLTTLTSRIQIAQRRNDRGEPLAHTLADLRRDAHGLDEVLTDMLLAAEGAPDAAAPPTPLAHAAASAVATLGPQADAAGVALVVDTREDASVRMPPATIRRVIVALVDNAIQHSPADSTVTVEVDRDGRWAQVRVSDQGDGILGIEPERVFDRFARSGETGRRRGFGLGLSLVREVATGHGGTVEVESTSAAGTTFVLRLPDAAA